MPTAPRQRASDGKRLGFPYLTADQLETATAPALDPHLPYLARSSLHCLSEYLAGPTSRACGHRPLDPENMARRRRQPRGGIEDNALSPGAYPVQGGFSASCQEPVPPWRFTAVTVHLPFNCRVGNFRHHIQFGRVAYVPRLRSALPPTATVGLGAVMAAAIATPGVVRLQQLRLCDLFDDCYVARSYGGAPRSGLVVWR